jgi:hypothetical protein
MPSISFLLDAQSGYNYNYNYGYGYGYGYGCELGRWV